MQQRLGSGGLPSPFMLLTWSACTSLCYLLRQARRDQVSLHGTECTGFGTGWSQEPVSI